MRIVCLVKFVPKVDDFKYDEKRHILIRTGVPLILNPDDAAALEYALRVKDTQPTTHIEVVSMGPFSLQNNMKDLLRRGIDRATLISDKAYAGSDSFVTAKVLATYLKKCTFDLILSGSQTLDGDTGHIGPQVAELLDIPQCSNVMGIEVEMESLIRFKVSDESQLLTLATSIPAMLSLSKESHYKLRFAKACEQSKNVDKQLRVVTNDLLLLDQVGLKGSPTKVKETFVVKMRSKEKQHVLTDDAGIEYVYRFLKDKGVIK